MGLTPSRPGRVLIIAGSDSGGGAGIQADIKAVTALGGFATTAVTALTVQNTLGVRAVHMAPLDIIEGQIRAVLDDIGADSLKTGMLGDARTVSCVVRAIGDYPAPLVVDPVMVAKGGHSLLETEAVEAVRRELLPLAALLTPNAPEAEVLSGLSIASSDDLIRVGEALLRTGVRAVLMKGGHLPGDRVTDYLITPDARVRFDGPRIETRHTHGTGCTLASAIATGLAHSQPLDQAVGEARAYLTEAIRRAPGFGAGHGPVDHGWPLRDQRHDRRDPA